MKIVLLVAALLATPLSAPAHAVPHHDTVRYATLKTCAKPKEHLPCGPWWLVLHSGRRQVLADAQTRALTEDGKSFWGAAPVAVSGDGTTVAYFSKKTRRLAVRTVGGGVVHLPAGAVPKAPQSSVALDLSDDGSRLAVTDGGRTWVHDTATGARLGTLPAAETWLGFSGDGDEVLTTAEGAGPVVDVVVRADTGERISRVTPPQIVAANMPIALAADGRTAAVLLARKSQILLYDVETDQVLGRVPVKLPKGDLHAIDWTGDREVTLHVMGKRNRMTIVEIDTETGAVRVRDRYTVPEDAYVLALCGG